MSEIKRITLSQNLISGGAGRFPIKAQGDLLSIQKGDILSVSVAKVLSAEKVLLTIAGEKVLADTGAPLKKGDTIRVLVEQQKPVILLRPLDETKSLNRTLFTSIRKAPPWDIHIEKLVSSLLSDASLKEKAEVFQVLKNSVLQENTLSEGGRNGAKVLKDLLQNSGLFLENRLAKGEANPDIKKLDVKGALLTLEKLAQRIESPEKGEILHKVTSLFSAVESLQNLNTLNRERGENLVLTIPFTFQGETRSLKIFSGSRKGSQKGESKDEFQVSLMLELSTIKKIRADIVKKRAELFITFLVGSEPIQNAVQTDFKRLQEKLCELGFHVHTNCLVSSEKYIEGGIPGKEFISDSYQTINFSV
ncbi:MAG: hypothetical protein ACE5FU_10455 [Nitrospinota bacterium]